MAADATDILAAVEAALAAAFPAVPVRVRKGRPGPGMESPLCGLTAADPTPVFVVSGQDAEPTETQPSFEHVSVGYPVGVAYVKAAEARPGRVEEDPEVRDVRAAVRRLLYRPRLAGAAQVRHCGIAEGPVYAEFRDNQTRVVSEQTLTFLAFEPRGGAP